MFLIHFEGDRDSFEASLRMLSECLLSQKVDRAERGIPWLALLVLSAILGVMGHQQFEDQRLASAFELVTQEIGNEPDYAVFTAERDKDRAHFRALRRPDSRPAEVLISGLVEIGDLSVSIEDTVVYFDPLPEPVVIKSVEKLPELDLFDVDSYRKGVM